MVPVAQYFGGQFYGWANRTSSRYLASVDCSTNHTSSSSSSTVVQLDVDRVLWDLRGGWWLYDSRVMIESVCIRLIRAVCLSHCTLAGTSDRFSYYIALSDDADWTHKSYSLNVTGWVDDYIRY